MPAVSGVTEPLLQHASITSDVISEHFGTTQHLPVSSGAQGNCGDDDVISTAAGEWTTSVWLAELKFLILLSAPAILQLCTQQGLMVTNQVRFFTYVPSVSKSKIRRIVDIP